MSGILAAAWLETIPRLPPGPDGTFNVYFDGYELVSDLCTPDEYAFYQAYVHSPDEDWFFTDLDLTKEFILTQIGCAACCPFQNTAVVQRIADAILKFRQAWIPIYNVNDCDAADAAAYDQLFALYANNLAELTRFAYKILHSGIFVHQAIVWQYLVSKGKSLGAAIQTAEQVGGEAQVLAADAYYKLLFKDPEEWFDPKDKGELGLSPDTRQRLLRGLWKMYFDNTQLADDPPLLQHHEECLHGDPKRKTECEEAFRRLWKGTVEHVESQSMYDYESAQPLPPSNLQEKLAAIHELLPDAEMIEEDIEDEEERRRVVDEIGMNRRCIENIWPAAINKFQELTRVEKYIEYFYR